ncbi:3-oxoadipate enol-lactonase [Pusillimonas sp. TS35]|uniref:3-oxoadipate enol-lactonase n=1 Tax=Paracandidimonas lactea TaxID=2895524 RepID=UPI001371EFF6|nr:3-oxoadipate enol-lactonase [Paracandidimonas lactea]MYN13118.1 3-oxoadipate enol-lactonase [Pusillimonas sp. TS35]
MTSAMINGAQCAYTLRGPAGAPVLVFSNSLGADQSMWASQAVLQDEFQLLTYDTRGHGQSGAPAGPYSLELLGRDVLGLLDHLGIGQAAFCGISMGGLIGQWLGIYAPDRLSRLVVANTAARVGNEQGWRDRAALVRAQGIGPVADNTLPRWFTPGFVATQSPVIAGMLAVLRGVSPEGYAACCDALAVADLRADIARISVPTLVIAGALDPVTTPADADFIAQQVTGAKRVDMPASHLSNVEAPEPFNQSLRSFLQG